MFNFEQDLLTCCDEGAESSLQVHGSSIIWYIWTRCVGFVLLHITKEVLFNEMSLKCTVINCVSNARQLFRDSCYLSDVFIKRYEKSKDLIFFPSLGKSYRKVAQFSSYVYSNFHVKPTICKFVKSIM